MYIEFMNKTSLTDPKFAALVEALSRPKRQGWGDAANMLGDVERLRHWQLHYSSFSGWVKAAAKVAGLQESQLWRLVGARRFYLTLSTEMPSADLPPIAEASQTVTAEQLELIDKISRVRPLAETVSLVKQALAGALSREQLRSIWKTVRDTKELPDEKALAYQAPPERRRDNRGDFRSMAEKSLYAALHQDTRWLGANAPFCCKILYRPKFAFPYRENADRHAATDFLVIHQATPASAVEIHALIGFEKPQHILDRLNAAAAFADFNWAVTLPPNKDYPGFDCSPLPQHLGILQLNRDETITVLRRPDHSTEADWVGAHAGELAKALLVEML